LQGNDDFQDNEDRDSQLWEKGASNILLSCPISNPFKSKYQAQPAWLLSSHDLKNNPPQLHCEDLSIHILNQGHEPACVLTIRQIDDEGGGGSSISKSSHSKIEEDSKKGVLGRILTGIRGKIVKVSALDAFSLFSHPLSCL
jgi:hypothetical protein